MRYPLSTILILAASCLWAQKPPAEVPDWTAATTLPQVDFTGLTPKQKTAALKSLHVENCVCGCNMKLAQCRVLDPACGDSKALSGMVGEAGKEAKAAGQMHE